MTKPVLVRVKALQAFTITRSYGQFHGDPDNRSDKAKKPLVPEDAVAELIRTKKAAPLRAAAAKSTDSKTAPASKGAKPKSELATMRDQYKAMVGKNPSPRMTADEIKAKLAEFDADPAALEAAKAAPAAPKRKPAAKKAAAAKTPKITADAPVD